MAAPGSVMARVCPACGRRVVPPSVICRCGKSVESVALTAVAVRAEPAPPPDTTRRDNIIKAAIALVGILIGSVMIYRSTRPVVPLKPVKASLRPASTDRAAQGAPATTAAPEPPRPAPADIQLPAAAESAPDTAASETPSDPARVPEAATDLPQPSAMPLETLIEHAMPGIVMVQTDKTRGSGFLVRPDLVVTNAHVTAGFLFATVTSQTGVKMQGRVAQFSDELDLALILVGRFSPTDAQLPLGVSASLRLGQGVVALGWAQSLEQHTVTRGVITGLRQLGTRPMIQTDAAPHPGDSGGPLLDRNGQVVGVTTIRLDGQSAAGGLAVPIDDVKPLIDRVATSVLTLPRSSVSAIVPRPPDTELQRASGLQRYAADVASIAARADSLDAAWGRYRVLCKVPSVPGQPREWFGLYDPMSDLNRAPDACPTLLNDLRRQADAIRAGMLAAGEMARHADVYPGNVRDIRKRYRLDYPGWDK